MVILLTMTDGRPSFPSDEKFYGETHEDTVKVQLTQEEESTIKEIKLQIWGQSNDPDYPEFIDQLNNLMENWLKIMANPLDREPYISLIYDISFSYVKTLLDFTLKQDAQRIYARRAELFRKAGVSEDDFYQLELKNFRNKYRSFIRFNIEQIPVLIVQFVTNGDMRAVFELLFQRF